MPKLTLSAKKHVIEKARRLADERGTSVSAMFSAFVETMSSPGPDRTKPAPITRRLRGVAKAPTGATDRELYERAIRGKARR